MKNNKTDAILSAGLTGNAVELTDGEMENIVGGAGSGSVQSALSFETYSSISAGLYYCSGTFSGGNNNEVAFVKMVSGDTIRYNLENMSVNGQSWSSAKTVSTTYSCSSAEFMAKYPYYIAGLQ